MFFEKIVHDNCQRRTDFDAGKFAADFGDEGCLMNLGCKGPLANCDAPLRKWNNQVSWCCQAGGPCLACTTSGFPDHGGEGLYARLPLERVLALSRGRAPQKWDAKVRGLIKA